MAVAVWSDSGAGDGRAGSPGTSGCAGTLPIPPKCQQRRRTTATLRTALHCAHSLRAIKKGTVLLTFDDSSIAICTARNKR